MQICSDAGAERQKCKILMLSLQRGWDLYTDCVTERFIEFSRWVSQTKFQLLSLTHIYLLSLPPSPIHSFNLSFAHSVTHSIPPTAHQLLCLTYSEQHIHWFMALIIFLLTRPSPHSLLPSYLPTDIHLCTKSVTISCSGITSGYKLVVSLRYLSSSRSNYVTLIAQKLFAVNA